MAACSTAPLLLMALPAPPFALPAPPSVLATPGVPAPCAVQQGIPAQKAPALKGCTPARAGYGTDLRDAALARAGAAARLVQQPVTFSMQGQPYSCLVNGQVGGAGRGHGGGHSPSP